MRLPTIRTGLPYLVALAMLAEVGCAAEKAEGRPWIHKISFPGLQRVSKRDLKSKISVQQTSWIPLSPKHYLDPYAVPGDRERIESYYEAHGYFDAKVTQADINYRKDKQSVDLVFKINEGEPTKIVKVDLVGLDGIGAAGARAETRVQLKAGQILVHDSYAAGKGRIARILQSRGYAWADVTGEVRVDRAAHTAEIKLVAVPGSLTHFGKVIIEGNAQVRAIDIERTADLHEGRKFDLDLVDEARGRVYGTGVFGSVKVAYEHDPNDPTVANVRVSVQEGQFRELRIGGGIGVEAQRNDIHLTAQFTKRNFFGKMRTLKLRLEPAFVVIPAVWSGTRKYGPALTAEAVFTQPFLFGLRHFELNWTVGYDLGIDYVFQFHGPRTQLGVNYGVWRQCIQLGLSYNIQFLDFFNTDPTILNDPDKAGAVFGYVDPYRIGWWQQDLSLDLHDKALDPHQGIYLLASFEEGGTFAGGAFRYEKIVPDARVYAPLGSRTTLAARVQFGQIFTQGELGSPITRRLFLGGPSSHRGFNYNRLAYQVPSALGGVSPIPIGGDQMILLQAELRVKIVKLFGNWFGAVVFADGGDVTLPNCNGTCSDKLTGALQRLDMSRLHWAVGGGLRYKTVIGTIRADVGVRLNRLEATTDGIPNPDPGDRIAFHLSVGEAF